MNFLGGKSRLCKEIGHEIRIRRLPSQSFLEPFCGAAWVTQHLYPGPVVASDIFAPLIQLHQAVQNGWKPPDFISDEEYYELCNASQEGEISPLITFVGFGVSWGGKWWGGYARGGKRNYCLEAKLSLLRKHNYLTEVLFTHGNYKTLEPKNCCIYCDPPYAGTTAYWDGWDVKEFWEIMRKWNQNNTVIISEYKAPEDFKIVWEHEHFSFKGSKSKPTVERLFQHV